MLESSWERLSLTKNCSRRLSDSGVNSADIGMTSPARIMIALRKASRQNKTVYLSCSCWLAGHPKVSDASLFGVHSYCVYEVYMRVCPSPAVPSVPNIELPEQIHDNQSCAAPWDVVDCLLTFYLHILYTNTHINMSSGKKHIAQTHCLHIITFVIITAFSGFYVLHSHT